MGLFTPLAVRIGALPWLPRLLPQITWLDRRLHRLSRGRLGLLDLAGLPNTVLTVKGRKSGRPRTTPLLCVPDGPDRLGGGSS
ncbi:nitroreductase/quinone reductase family protein, partial [Nocardiopsis prasina]|uniref:nitroreductase/quinone reductase family protein n=1 Tax=Nocardiopsis prasina TaxID=2015 RepID=UPI000377B249